MNFEDLIRSSDEKLRIVQELVPGKQISIAHVIANPDDILYTKLGLDPTKEYKKEAIGVVTITPAETAIIIADIALKSSGAELGFVDRFSGTLILIGTVSEVLSSIMFLYNKFLGKVSVQIIIISTEFVVVKVNTPLRLPKFLV